MSLSVLTHKLYIKMWNTSKSSCKTSTTCPTLSQQNRLYTDGMADEIHSQENKLWKTHWKGLKLSLMWIHRSRAEHRRKLNAEHQLNEPLYIAANSRHLNPAIITAMTNRHSDSTSLYDGPIKVMLSGVMCSHGYTAKCDQMKQEWYFLFHSNKSFAWL